MKAHTVIPPCNGVSTIGQDYRRAHMKYIAIVPVVGDNRFTDNMLWLGGKNG